MPPLDVVIWMLLLWLNRAYMEATQNGGCVYLFFSVSGIRQFCGMAAMTSRVDFSKDSIQAFGEVRPTQ